LPEYTGETAVTIALAASLIWDILLIFVNARLAHRPSTGETMVLATVTDVSPFHRIHRRSEGSRRIKVPDWIALKKD
jgi:hypothetical protein